MSDLPVSPNGLIHELNYRCPICGEKIEVLHKLQDEIMEGALSGHPEYKWVRVQELEVRWCDHRFGRWFGCDEHGNPLVPAQPIRAPTRDYLEDELP